MADRSEPKALNVLASYPAPHVRRLIEAAAEILDDPHPTDRDRAFMARQLVQATLPHSDPGNVPVWTRTNGRLTLVVRPYFDITGHRHLHPYGSVPRLLLFWLTTETVRTKSRILYPGNTMAEFMRKLGLNPDNGSMGAKRSDARRLRDQMLRLFRATISFEVSKGTAVSGTHEWLDMQVATSGHLWWDFREPNQGALFESVVELGEKFHQAIMATPVPVDMRALRALKRSPLALDLYAWSTYRAFTVSQAGRPAFIPWASLAAQMGADHARLDNFVTATKSALRRVQTVYPALRIAEAKGGLMLEPSAPAVPRRATG